ncbi:uncharacterized protein LAESUDRAFT_810363 [Laetiporus sulphureus 93-53]|uniref:Uncharacterized protein n=1 Tax=Laetiporus sulphureus 93-53 TaxID=1314785 RepID=A0A165GAR2_9APHY|nr:uncharacterized protein LAESUDRAFT_810363 [Laetiporus sulphureus 93-53]KZT10082.1 hypothetical protein LAESUDRAFT_810363 [Laetiporus sulphureus 93-53]
MSKPDGMMNHHYLHHQWGMRPFRHRGGRFFPRLFWFVVGAASASFWIKTHQAADWKDRHCWRACISQKAYPPPGENAAATMDTERRRAWGGWHQHDGPWGRKDGLADNANGTDGERRRGWGGWHHHHDGPWGRKDAPAAGPTQDAQQATLPAQSPPLIQPPHVPPPPMPSDRWDEDRQRIQALGKQATDTISELSEATLDSVLATVQNLKMKLAENRAQREEHMKQMQALKDDQMKMFEEWKKQYEQKREQEKSSEPRHLV